MRTTRTAISCAAVFGAALLGWWGVALAADPLNPGDLANRLGTLAVAAGALGTAAFGIVDGLKLIPWVDLAGFERLFSRASMSQARRWPTTIRANLDPLVPALVMAYGNEVMELLKAQYRSGRGKGDLPRTLRQGVRIGLGLVPDADVAKTARDLGLSSEAADRVGRAIVATRSARPPALGQPATAVQPAISDEDRAALARLETAIDARIDAALVLAETLYVTQTKLVASVVAVGIGFGVGKILGAGWVGLVVGLVAVPLAPVAHDAATALQEAVKAVQAVKAR